MRKALKYLFLFANVLIVACSHTKELDPASYVHYVESPDNGLLLKEKINGVGYSLQYQPTDYLVMLEMRSFQIPEDTFKMEYNRFKGLEHYNFHIARKEIDSIVSKMNDTAKIKKQVTEYFDFKIQKDIKLLEGSDTVKCAICQCESDGNITPYYSFVLGFPKKNYDGDRRFVFYSKVLGTGEVKLTVKGSKMRDIPALKMI
jgi:hypothetical protein